MKALLAYVAKLVIFLICLGFCGKSAFEIRLYAIKTYGLVIHEFDPWFNFRATQYLADHGWYDFFHWFDYESWYPLGRPVGTTIYPGMQISSVFIWTTLNKVFSYAISLNDVCCYVPAWFGISATFFLGLLTSECSGSWSAGVGGAAIMSIVPAHIMRSVGGGYDNESIAVTAMCATFYFWCRSLRADPNVTEGKATRDSYIFGVITGFSYIYMVAAWGGFVFVLNLIAVHAAVLCVLGRFTSKLHRAYSIFFVIGTIGAIQVPVVGWNPLKSFEQLAALGVFLGFQILEYCEIQQRKNKLSMFKKFLLRVKVSIPFVIILAVVVSQLLAMGYFGPLTARVRGLFVKHTRTGNPLVDSVAEHQPASEQAYQQYLHHIYYLAPVGFGLSFLRLTDANVFLIAYAGIAYYFSSKMARLIILLGPVASALGGVAIGFGVDQLVLGALATLLKPFSYFADAAPKITEDKGHEEAKEGGKKKKGKDKKGKANKSILTFLTEKLADATSMGLELYNNRITLMLRLGLAVYLVTLGLPKSREFIAYSNELAVGMSQPSIMFQATLRNGETIIVDDYREAYWWLRDNTPQDARVMAWWDYGYQIAGIANRTTIADGNTWNHEHIATLGRCLTANEKKAHRIAKHLADYVLVWTGGGGDDLAKSPHMARIGNSVYPDICPDDPTCSRFGFYQGGQPTEMMRESLLYKMTQYGIKPEVKLSPSRFTMAFQSKYGKVRIFKVQNVSQDSKKWVADPANRVCDAPGSWYCSGQYPPALQPLIKKRKNFAQLEDFNVKTDDADKKYNEDYMAKMSGKKPAAETKASGKKPKQSLTRVGCYGSEGAFGEARVYGGGQTGSNLALGAEFAIENGHKYMAVARVEQDGHSFFFNNPPTGDALPSDEGCERACPGSPNPCGCADDGCGSLAPVAGEEHRRRWVLYELHPDKKKKPTKKKTKGKKEEL